MDNTEKIDHGTKLFIEESIQKFLKCKSKRDNFYEHELLTSYKIQIEFLKEEHRKKDEIINKLLERSVSCTHNSAKSVIQILFLIFPPPQMHLPWTLKRTIVFRKTRKRTR